ncbi:BPTI/Kunitz domain-containing protein-like isoform X2 [Ostrea edulis]|uniref:BPTI/Kunitz domain-containing protein-like isoform X2 n=1 Tax=Ostrea edulis TaxID=37623 RepID=UPI0024AF0E02|nr:BPTI/Kunitz domain-containing protein-like isoform X2 [Ostrea edulis]
MQLPILFSVLTVAFAGSYGPGEKPGQCPSEEGRAFPCVCLPGPSQCSNDYDCDYGLKCCSYGCSCQSYCVRPVFGPGPQPGPIPVPQPGTCFYNGRSYNPGESFPAVDGCNNCICFLDGSINCSGFPCDVCTQPKVVGPCYAAFRRWWYNQFTNRCERFIYGGCQGNENNFQTEADCRRRCRRNKY